MDQPTWFKQLKWSKPVHVRALNLDRSFIPDFPGCYVFTEGPGPISPGRVLYVGEATQSLRARLAVYLVDFRKADASLSDNVYSAKKKREHKGKGFVLEARDKLGDAKLYVRWVEYGANDQNIHVLEASLINFLNPRANDRIEEYRHPILGDDERLNRNLIR